MRSFLIGLAALSVFGVCLTSGCGDSEEAPPDVLVTVYDDYVTMRDLNRSWVMLPESERKNYVGPEGVDQLIDELITWKLMAQEAEKRELHKVPDFKDRMAAYRQRLLVNQLLDRAVTDADIFHYYQQHFTLCRFIFIKFPEQGGEQGKMAAKKKADEVHALITPEADFGEIAKEHSDAANKVQGGMMGYVTHQTVANMAGLKVAEGLFSLGRSLEITAPIEGNDGYFIFQMLEPTNSISKNGLTKELEKHLRDIKQQEAISSLASELNSRPESRANTVKNMEGIKQVKENLQRQMDLQKQVDIAPASTVDGATAAPTAPGPGDTAE